MADSAQLYKVVNSDGTVTYTDTYQAGAEEVDLSSSNSAVMPSMSSSSNTTNQIKKQVKKFPKLELEFVSPQQEQTIRDNLGRMTVSARLVSDSKQNSIPAGIFQLILNGKLVQSQPAPTFTLDNLDRGEHKIQIQLVLQTGKILASTETRVFFMRRASSLITPSQ